jgi:hypothetical protein
VGLSGCLRRGYLGQNEIAVRCLCDLAAQIDTCFWSNQGGAASRGAFMPSGTRIVGLCIAKNEADIIEAMVRHNLGFLDQLHVVDNDSADATPGILAALEGEFGGR